jgi:hypothetical protein
MKRASRIFLENEASIPPISPLYLKGGEGGFFHGVKNLSGANPLPELSFIMEKR